PPPPRPGPPAGHPGRHPAPPPRPAPTPPAATRPRPPRRKRRWGRRLGTLLLVVTLAAVAAVIGGGIWADNALHRIPALADYPERPAAGAGTTWLLVGSDSRQHLSDEQQGSLSTGGDLGDGRTDTILLVHLPRWGSAQPATVVSIPRDSYLPIPDYGEDKVNATYSMGGAPLLVQTVEQATGLRVEHYLEVGFGGFAGLVDALGGVEMCLTEPMADPLAGIDLPAGCQQLDGAAALGYVRTRATPRADLDRMVDQRMFLGALLQRAVSPGVLLNPWRWVTVPRAAIDALTVDDGDRVWDLARLAWALRGDTATVTVPIGEFTATDSGAVVVWDHAAAGQLFDALRTDSPLPADVLDSQP
ncbi:LCP family protein, partial [Mycolicibacillus trivialis]